MMRATVAPNNEVADFEPLMLLSMSHFTSQAQYTVVKLQIPDILNEHGSVDQSNIGDFGQSTEAMLIDEIAMKAEMRSKHQNDSTDGKVINKKQINRDALLRTMRLLASVGIFQESPQISNSPSAEEQFSVSRIAFSLTSSGRLLCTEKSKINSSKNLAHGQYEDSLLSLAGMIQHWMEPPLWNAWSQLPNYVAPDGVEEENKLPFDRANDGMSAAEYYGKPENSDSLKYANQFTNFVLEREIQACVDFDWSFLSGKTVVDLGGNKGHIIKAVCERYPTITGICFDLPEVISRFIENNGGKEENEIQYVGGDIFDASTFPPCDAIFMKHIVFCDWDDEKSREILRNCHKSLPNDGKVIIAEAVLPNPGDNIYSIRGKLQLFSDALMMLVGRDSAKTEMEWNAIARQEGFKIESIYETPIPTSYIIVLTKHT